MYECPKCHHKFNDQSVYCEDWRDKEKCFGCPNCKLFFSKLLVGKMDWVQFVRAFAWSALVYVLLFMVLPEVWWANTLMLFIPILIFSLLAVRANRNIKLKLTPISEAKET